MNEIEKFLAEQEAGFQLAKEHAAAAKEQLGGAVGKLSYIEQLSTLLTTQWRPTEPNGKD